MRVRIRCTISVCDSRPSTNQPDWNSVWCSGALAWNTYHMSAYVAISKTELIGPKNTMKRPRPSGSHCWGRFSNSSSTLSNGIAVWEMSYIKFCNSRWMGSMGRNGRKALATRTEKTLPKFELAVIFRYLSMLQKVLRPSITPSSSTIRLFSSRMMSAASFEMSTAESTEIPTSAARSAGASLMPSPMNPTVQPCALRLRTIRSLWAGVRRANTLASRTEAASCRSSISSMAAPR
ncbi:hypothetical protein D9M68_600450 [compost metagenome]